MSDSADTKRAVNGSNLPGNVKHAGMSFGEWVQALAPARAQGRKQDVRQGLVGQGRMSHHFLFSRPHGQDTAGRTRQRVRLRAAAAAVPTPGAPVLTCPYSSFDSGGDLGRRTGLPRH